MSNNQMVSVPSTTPEGMVRSINALLALDARGSLVPHGVGGLARDLLTKCAEVLSRPAEQHQGEPVAYQKPSDYWAGFGYTDRSCHIELRKMVDHLESLLDAIPDGPLYTRPAPSVQQGEPVAWLDPNAGLSWLVDRMTVAPGTKLYTHADPAEVERLRADLAEWKKQAAYNQDTALRWQADNEALRAQLAEAHALLRDLLPWMERINEKSNEDIPQVLRLRAALSASAEPSAPLESVEREAQRIYESWEGQPGYVPWVTRGNSLKQDEARRQARAALERKP